MKGKHISNFYFIIKTICSFTFESSFSCVMCNCMMDYIDLFTPCLFILLTTFIQHLQRVTICNPEVKLSSYATRAEWKVPQRLSYILVSLWNIMAETAKRSLREALLLFESQGQQWSHLSHPSSSMQLKGCNHGSAEDHKSQIERRKWRCGP